MESYYILLWYTPLSQAGCLSLITPLFLCINCITQWLWPPLSTCQHNNNKRLSQCNHLPSPVLIFLWHEAWIVNNDLLYMLFIFNCKIVSVEKKIGVLDWCLISFHRKSDLFIEKDLINKHCGSRGIKEWIHTGCKQITGDLLITSSSYTFFPCSGLMAPSWN